MAVTVCGRRGAFDEHRLGKVRRPSSDGRLCGSASALGFRGRDSSSAARRRQRDRSNRKIPIEEGKEQPVSIRKLSHEGEVERLGRKNVRRRQQYIDRPSPFCVLHLRCIPFLACFIVLSVAVAAIEDAFDYFSGGGAAFSRVRNLIEICQF